MGKSLTVKTLTVKAVRQPELLRETQGHSLRQILAQGEERKAAERAPAGGGP